jgi:hypothetical protein
MSEEQCSLKTRLLRHYQTLMLEYVNALTDLQSTMGVMSKAQYDTRYERLEGLRTGAEKSRFYYDSHVHEHGC